MKRYFTLLAATMLLILPSCRFIRISDGLKKQLKEQGIEYNANANGDKITASEVMATREKQPGDFSSLICMLPCDMTYLPGDCKVTINGPDNVLEHIELANDGGTLTIKSDGTNFRKLKDLDIILSAPVLKDLTVNGAMDFSAPKGISSTDFSVTVNGAGDIDIQGLKARLASVSINGAGDLTINGIDTEELSVEINGAGDATLSGSTGKATLNISGAGDIDAAGLKADVLDTKSHGIGRIKRPKH